ncbi:MAG: TRCF domain-containing protein, partial [Lachnospiraceae bacterium]
MKERELERIMLDFINGEIDVLVSTTIIETGLDISNVNTIIIHDADRFGLSQLYQLRGRVGRSSRTAYAFLMYRRDRMLREVAEKRLSAIREYTELGSGIKIAMRDLELRGAGNLLGAEQHGHMEAVGYDLYCKLLGMAVQELKGEKVSSDAFETTIDLQVDAFIPDTYIRNEAQKMSVYKKIAAVETEEDLTDMQDELIDRFGDLPRAVQNLIRVALIRSLAHEAYVTELSGNREELKFQMYKEAPVDPSRIADFLAPYRGDIRVSVGPEPCFTYRDQRKRIVDTPSLLDVVRQILTDMQGLVATNTEKKA